MNASKKVIALTEDKIESLRFDVEWDTFDQLQDFINMSKSKIIVLLSDGVQNSGKSNLYEDGLKAKKLIETMQKGLDKRNNLIAASMVFDTLNNPQ